MMHVPQSPRSFSRSSVALLASALLLGGLMPQVAPAVDPAFHAPVFCPFGLVDGGNRCAPSFVDLDGDSDLDVVVGKGDGTLFFQPNTGSSSSPAFGATASPFNIVLPGALFASPDFVDIDGDGDFDAFVGNSFFPYSGRTRYFENIGNSSNPNFSINTSLNPLGIGTTFLAANPEFVEIDGDGDFDVFIGEYGGYTRFFRNTGTGTPAFVAEGGTTPFGIIPIGANYRYTAPSFGDLDGDGDVDSLIGNGDGNFYFFRNTGNASTAAFSTPSTNPFGVYVVGGYANPELVDIDGDGDLDLFVGSSSGGPYFFRNTSTATPDIDPPTSSASIVATITTNVIIPVKFTAIDSGSGVEQTDLFVKRPGDVSYSNTGLTPIAGANGTFFYTATAGDGLYQFFTVSTDYALNIELLPASPPDDSITLDTTGPTIPGGIALLASSPTNLDAVRFGVTFSESVGSTFTISDVVKTGTLASTTKLFLDDSLAAPAFVVIALPDNANANGTIGISLTGIVQDALGNPATVPVSSPLYTITNHPPGDVNKDGVLNIADVALLADANLSLVTLP